MSMAAEEVQLTVDFEIAAYWQNSIQQFLLSFLEDKIE